MFFFPLLPPKDHVIKEIPKSLLSSQEFTPDSGIRVTLPEIGRHSVAIKVTESDPPTQTPFVEVNPAVVNTWVKRDRDNWLVRPGKDDYFIHDMFKKYNVSVCDSYDARYLHKPPVFSRSFKYELDCLESLRLKKLEEKMQRDADEAKLRLNKHVENHAEKTENQDNSPTSKPFLERWQPQPHLFAPSQKDPCKRRQEFALVGKPFKNEACNWYYKNYPPPKVEWRPEKFS